MNALGELLFKKAVDQSLLKAGVTLPVEIQDHLLETIRVSLVRGQQYPIEILIRDVSYKATLTYVDLDDKYADRNVIQIRYSEKSPICLVLNDIFSFSASIIPRIKTTNGKGRKRVIIPENNREYIEIYAHSTSTLEFRCYPKVSDDTLKSMFDRILNEYSDAKKEKFAQHPMGSFFRKNIPSLIYSTGIVNSHTHLITGSVGQGNWATVPWFCIFDRSITTSATKGIDIAYLLSTDGNSLYITLNQGCTDIRNTHTKHETIAIMRKKAKEIRSVISRFGFQTDDEISLGNDLHELAELYEKGTIFYKEYKKGAVPSEMELRTDLTDMMRIYNDYAEYERTGSIKKTGGEMEMSIEDAIKSIKAYIAARGFSYEDGLVENFYLSLKSKPFVLLAGTSGTGKTRLVKLFAEAVGANCSNGRYKMVAVRPDWSDSSDLFGHVDLRGNFIPGAIIDFVKQAELDKAHPYFLCLDEMNLARVEYYLSDFLSVIETREFNSKREIISDPLVSANYYGDDTNAVNKYGTLTLPGNLYIIGTVNMDETTFPFSKKVLDRANTIEFSYVDLMPRAQSSESDASDALDLPNTFLKTEYLLLSQCGDEADTVEIYCSQLRDLNRILLSANAHVGYRVRDEIVFYMLNNKKAKLLADNVAMDNEITQKILPRIQGSGASVKNMLCELFKHCASDYEGIQTESDDIVAKMERAIQRSDCRYPRSAAKITFMVRRYEEDGFTSYWL